MSDVCFCFCHPEECISIFFKDFYFWHLLEISEGLSTGEMDNISCLKKKTHKKTFVMFLAGKKKYVAESVSNVVERFLEWR